MLGIKFLHRANTQPAPPTPFEQGYKEASALAENAPFDRPAERILMRLGVYAGEAHLDNYELFDPVAERTTELRFGGDHNAFWQFSDGVHKALEEAGIIRRIEV